MHNGPSGVLSSCDLRLPCDDDGDFFMVKHQQSDPHLYLHHHHHHHHHSDSSSTCSSSLSPKLTSSSPTATPSNPSASAVVSTPTALADIDPQLAQHIEYELGLTKKNGNGNGTRKNAWGNLSYAELISKAITSSAEQRLTLSEIYDWMIKYVPFFRNKVDRISSAGWKNSIRHNLSLHNRFKRVQSEGTGKSSWWMINPDEKTSTSNGSSPSHSGTKQVRRRLGQNPKSSTTTTATGKRLRPGRSSKSNSRHLTSSSQNEVQQQQPKSSSTAVIASRDIPVVLYEDQASWVNQSENDLTTNPLYEQGLYSTSVNTPSTTTSTGNSTSTTGAGGGGGCLPSTYSYDDVTSNYIGNSSTSNAHTGDYSSYHHFHSHSHHPQTLYQHHHPSTYPLNSRNAYYQTAATPGTSVSTDPSSNVNCSLTLDTYHPANPPPPPPPSYSLSQQQQSQVTNDPTDEHLFLRVQSCSSHSPNSSLSPPTNANLVTSSSSSGSSQKPSSSASSSSSGGYLHPTSNGTLTLYSHHHPHHPTHLALPHPNDMETYLQLNADIDDLDDDEDLSTLVHHPGLIDEQGQLASFYSNSTPQHHSPHPHAHHHLHHHHHLPQTHHLHHHTHNQNHSLFSHHDTSILRTVLKRPILDLHNQQV